MYIKALSKGEPNKNKLFENFKNQENLNLDNLNLIQNQSGNNENNKKKIKYKKYELISDLRIFSLNPVFFLKCKFKSDLKPITYYYGQESTFQRYIFYDIKGEEIQAIAFKNGEYFNKIINAGSVYEISKVNLMKKEPEYNIISSETDFQLSFDYKTKIKQLADNGEFNNVKIIKQFTKIEKLTKEKLNEVLNIKGIILEDSLNIQKIKDNGEIVKYRNLLIGDNTLHKINFKLWESNFKKDINFSLGDIIFIFYTKYKQYHSLNELHSLINTEIEIC